MVTHVRFGLAGLTGQAPDGTREGFNEALRSLVDLAVLGEEHGFDSVWASEHHFIEDGYLPSPLVALAAVAEATSHVRIGTQVLIAPLYDPIRLAEDCAVLDQLSNGRLALGVGLGYQAPEYAAFKVPRSGRVALLTGCISTLRTAWSGGPIPIDGGTVNIRPLPFQEGGPPILIGAIAEPAVKRAARLANGLVAPIMNLSAFGRRLDWLRDEGVSSGFRCGIYIHAFVAADNAWEKVRPSIQYLEQQIQRFQQGNADFARFHTVDRGDVSTPPEHVIVGTPDEVVQRLSPYYDLLATAPGDGCADMIVRLTYPGLPQKVGAESIRLFASEVVPRLDRKSVV